MTSSDSIEFIDLADFLGGIDDEDNIVFDPDFLKDPSCFDPPRLVLVRVRDAHGKPLFGITVPVTISGITLKEKIVEHIHHLMDKKGIKPCGKTLGVHCFILRHDVGTSADELPDLLPCLEAEAEYEGIAVEDVATFEVEMLLRLKGGGKPVVKTGIKAKKMAEKNQELNTKATGFDANKFTNAQTIATNSRQKVEALYHQMESNADTALIGLLRGIPVEVLGNREKSELMDCIKSGRPETRVENLVKMFGKHCFKDTHDIAQEFQTHLESIHLTGEMLLTKLFLKDGGNWDWNLVKRYIEDEMVRRSIHPSVSTPAVATPATATPATATAATATPATATPATVTTAVAPPAGGVATHANAMEVDL
eukprot:s1070_g21.t1